jgi:LacI family transcriptional regulator
LAGVSRSTVSRVVNDYPNVPDSTKKHVLEVIEKHGYVPHASARLLAGAENKIIGLFMVDKKRDAEGRKVSTSSYFSPFITGVIDSANEYGFRVLAYAVCKQDDIENVKRVFYDKTISGGIFIGQQNDKDTSELIARGYKVVLIDKGFENMDKKDIKNCIIVNADNYNGAYKATKYLIDLGHRKIAHVTGHLNQLSTIERLEGYKKALSDANIELDAAQIVRGNFMREGGYEATKKLLLQSSPTAIFYCNDSMAIGGAQAIEEEGYTIPEDISIIGFDDIELSRYFRPPLTTIRLPLWDMSAIAVRTLIAAIKSEPDFSAHYMVPVELIERKSCRRLTNIGE